jgi:hypothetical protein
MAREKSGNGHNGCEGPYMARRLQRLAHLLRTGFFGEAAAHVEQAAISICESLPRKHGGKGRTCHCGQWRPTQRIPLPNCFGNSRREDR